MCFGFFLSPNRGVSRMIKEPLKWIWGSPNVRKPLNLIHRCRIYTYVINMQRYVLLMCIDHILGPMEMWYLFHVFSSQAI
jgi:hypothetical protein